MSLTEETQFELQDTNIAVGYVTSIVDVWLGDRDDPAVEIQRFIGVWSEDQIQKSDGPDFSRATVGRYGSKPTPRPVIWELLEVVKAADREAEKHKAQQEQMMNDGYSYGTDRAVKTLYQAFMAAIDVLAVDDTNEEAWAAVEAYREYQAGLHEK